MSFRARIRRQNWFYSKTIVLFFNILDRKHHKTHAFSTFWSENTIKPIWANYNNYASQFIACEPLNYVGKGNSISKARYRLAFSRQCISKVHYCLAVVPCQTAGQRHEDGQCSAGTCLQQDVYNARRERHPASSSRRISFGIRS